MPARSRLWPDPRVKPPFGGAEINWSHPLSQGLLWYVPFSEGGGGPVDMVSRLVGTPASGARQTGSSRGLAFDASPGGYVTFPKIAAFQQATSTIISSCRSDGNVANYLHAIVSVNHNGSNTPYLLTLGPSFESVRGYGFNDGSWHMSAITTDTRGDNKDHSIVGTYNGSTLSYYMDGVLDSTASYSGTQSLSNTNTLDVARYAGASWPFQGPIYYVGLYSRALAASEVQWLHREPYVMLRPIVRRHYSVPATPGGPRKYLHYAKMRA